MKVTEHVYLLESTKGSYAYLLQLENKAIVIDTCFPGKGQKILDEIKGLGVAPTAISDILITHHDVDHVGNAAFLQQATGANVWASAVAAQYILGKKKEKGIRRFLGAIMKYKKPVINNVYDGGVVASPGITIIETPGHIAGHVSILWKDVLFTGDVVVTSKGKITKSPKLFTWDNDVLNESIKKLGKLHFTWVCPAHGEPLQRGDLWENIDL